MISTEVGIKICVREFRASPDGVKHTTWLPHKAHVRSAWSNKWFQNLQKKKKIHIWETNYGQFGLWFTQLFDCIISHFLEVQNPCQLYFCVYKTSHILNTNICPHFCHLAISNTHYCAYAAFCMFQWFFLQNSATLLIHTRNRLHDEAGPWSDCRNKSRKMTCWGRKI